MEAIKRMLPEVEGRHISGASSPNAAASEPPSACGMSRQVRDLLVFTTMPQKIMPPEAGMCGITTSKQPGSLSGMYVPIAGVEEAIAARE